MEAITAISHTRKPIQLFINMIILKIKILNFNNRYTQYLILQNNTMFKIAFPESKNNR